MTVLLIFDAYSNTRVSPVVWKCVLFVALRRTSILTHYTGLLTFQETVCLYFCAIYHTLAYTNTVTKYSSLDCSRNNI